MNNKILSLLLVLTLSLSFQGCRSLGRNNDLQEQSYPEQADDQRAFEEGSNDDQPAEHYTGVSAGQPQQIALLLPLSGKNADSAKAIQAGFFASYYDHAGKKPNVKVYDTTKGDIQQVYETAVHEGADFVVGPLAKEDVQRLGSVSHRLRTPVLALNYHPSVRASNKFAQFALTPEAEADQLADKAWQKGLRSASLIAQDNAWGRRVTSAFSQRWQSLGGRIIHTVYTNPSADQSAAVQRLLGVDQSQKRANHIKALLTEKVEFKPRRRQDVDVIIMAATPDQARQLKPLLDFYYAEDIPVYATSSIYNGHPNARRDRDLNGIVFGDMPWMIDSQRGNKMQQLLSRNGASQSDQYNRLFAMGVDAYQLTSHYGLLQSNPAAHYPGNTGNLSLGTQNQIERKLSWAKMVNGVPTPIN
jgi:hypothetical protein